LFRDFPTDLESDVDLALVQGLHFGENLSVMFLAKNAKIRPMADSLLITATPPILTFLLAKIGEIGAQQRVSRSYKQAQEELAFWKSFVEIQTDLCSHDQLEEIKRSAHLEVESIRARLIALRTDQPISLPISKLRRMLLLYPGRNPTAWIGRIAFFAMNVYAILLIGEWITDKNIKSWSLFSLEFSLVFLVLVLAAWSRRIALRADGALMK